VSGVAASLWRHSDFLKLWSAAAISAFGARITREGLPMVAVMTLGANPAQVGLLAALSRGPGLLVGLFAGGPVDRSRKRPVLIAADLIRALILMALPFAALAHSLNLVLVYIAAAVVGAANALFEIAHHAYLPSLIARARLVDGNSKLSTTDAVAEVGGPALAGLLFQWLTAPIAIAVNVATYLASAVFLGLIGAREPRPEAPPTPPEHLLSDAMAGGRVILAHPLVRPIAMMEVGANLFGAFFSALYTLYALRTLGLTPALLGVTVALGGVGGVIGAALTPVLVRRVGVGRAFVGLATVGALFNFAIPLAPVGALGGTAALGFAQLFGDALLTGAFILNGSLRQSLLPVEVLGRASGAIAAAAGLAGIVGALAGGWLGVVAGPRLALLVAAMGIFAAALVPLFSPVRSYREPA
jgi:MFS family permease